MVQIIVTIIDRAKAMFIALVAFSLALSHFDTNNMTTYVMRYNSTGKQTSNIIVFVLLLDIDCCIHIF